MSGSLPVTIDPILLAERGVRLRGRLPVKSMPRLREVGAAATGEIDVDLWFEHSPGEEVREMGGELRARVRMICQRCLEAMDLDLLAQPRVVLLRPGESDAAAAPDVDTLMVDKPLSLSALVEEELLLVMPMAAMHEPAVCPAGGGTANAPGAPRRNPFSGLSRLKHR